MIAGTRAMIGTQMGVRQLNQEKKARDNSYTNSIIQSIFFNSDG